MILSPADMSHRSIEITKLAESYGIDAQHAKDLKSQLEKMEAFEAAALRLGITAEWFTLFPANEPLPHYVILVEPASGGNGGGMSSLGLEVDRQLASCNTEYRATRDSQRLAPPEVWIAAPGSYASWHQSRIDDGANDGQIKPIHLTRDSQFGDGFTILERCDAS